MYKRVLDKKIKDHFKKYKQALVLLGARQVGKTTMLKRLFPDALYLLIDEKPVFDILETYNSDSYKSLIGKSKAILIDELHLLSDPGRAVKLIYDQLDDIKIVVTGSSSLHIKNKTSESMAGRAINYHLYPLTFMEFLRQRGIEESPSLGITKKILSLNSSIIQKKYNLESILENTLIYGQYPHLVESPSDKLYLINLVEKAIFKDIIELNLIENRAKALELLRLLAYQIGNLINYSELASRIGLGLPTVLRYIEIFEQSFIIHRVFPFSKKKRNEISKSSKIYFWDLGLRNALINNFDNLNIRNDTGAIFENFIINEVKKEIDYLDLNYKLNYWRLKSGTEIDIVLSNQSTLLGCEIKFYNGKPSNTFQKRYPEAKMHLVTSKNFLSE